jgi:hypothetical protein
MLITTGIVQDSLRQFKNYFSIFSSDASDSPQVILDKKDAYFSINSFLPTDHKLNLSKVLSSGELEWQKKIVSSNNSNVDVIISGIKKDIHDNILLFGYLNYNTNTDRPSILMKLNPNGDIVWQKSALTLLNGYNYTHWTHAALDSQGNTYVSGWVSAMFDGNESQNGMPLVKYNSSGEVQWTRFISTVQFIAGICVDSQDNVIIGNMTQNPFPTSNYFNLVKYSPSGDLIFQKHLSTPYTSTQQLSLESDGLGNIFVTAKIVGTTVLKLNPSGAILWSRRVDNGMQIFASAVDKAGNLYLVGSNLNGPLMGGLIVKISTSGNLIWQRVLSEVDPEGSFSNLAFRSVDCDELDNIIVSGTFRSGTYSDVFTAYIPSDGSKTGTYAVNGKSFIYADNPTTMANETRISVVDASFFTGRTVTIYNNDLPLSVQPDTFANSYVTI